MKIIKEGFPFIIVPLLAGLGFIVIPCALGLGIPALFYVCLAAGIILIIFALFCAFFFRDPKIIVNGGADTGTAGAGLILSPCNGTVLEIEETETEKILRVFLSIFNVHLQRSPVAGTVRDVAHKDGKFYAAWNPLAQSENEQNIITIEGNAGVFVVRQIAGFLARRCVSWVKAGDELRAGDKIGLIKFSSQVDLHMPKGAEITVKAGDKVRAGVTPVGTI
ncbi:MAG: phosphatidylserine decarboxylase [Treponema sp.]|jgi:phosphatidylserine decarboxylase|nr:phosphatidylserine decarboxylase [Treponema sp.]